MKKIIITILLTTFLNTINSYADVYKITFYCACKICCGKNAKGITASGKKIQKGMVACNHLPFGTKILINDIGIYTVEDRGSKKYFGDKENIKKHIDVYVTSHKEALNRGIIFKEVITLGE